MAREPEVKELVNMRPASGYGGWYISKRVFIFLL